MGYDPTLGRFLERDPEGHVDGMNSYEFVGSNPVVYVDPLGTRRWYEGWGNTIYAAFGGYGADAAGSVWGAAGRGGLQGGANTLNGAQDGLVGIANLPGAVVNSATGRNTVPSIPSPDWSYGLVTDEDCDAHAVSKFAGGQGLLTLATLGASQLGTAGRLTHITTVRVQALIEADAAAGLGHAGIQGRVIYASARPTYTAADAILTGTGRAGGYVSIPGRMVAGFRPIPAVGPISGWARFAGGGYVYGRIPFGPQAIDAALGQGLLATGQVTPQSKNCRCHPK